MKMKYLLNVSLSWLLYNANKDQIDCLVLKLVIEGIRQNMYDHINCLAAEVKVFPSIISTCQDAEQSTNLIVVPLCLAREASLSLLSSHRAPPA